MSTLKFSLFNKKGSHKFEEGKVHLGLVVQATLIMSRMIIHTDLETSRMWSDIFFTVSLLSSAWSQTCVISRHQVRTNNHEGTGRN